MRGNVFINYRREDSAGWTGRLHDRMACELPARRIFIDVDNIEPGENFAHKLDEQVAQCDVFLPVIGPRWLAVSDEGGNRRIDNPADFVRIEIASAIRRDNVHIIPVLVDGARMPSENDLPDELRSLVQRNALEISGKRFHRDAQHLVEAVKASLPWRVRHFRGLRRAAAASVLLAAAAVLIAAIASGALPNAFGLEKWIRPSAAEWARFTYVDKTNPALLYDFRRRHAGMEALDGR